MVGARARDLALINRRTNEKPTPDDWAAARRELTDSLGNDHDPVEDLPTSKRWDPVPGTTGLKIDRVPAEDEQSLAEVLVEEGLQEAEHEHMVEGTRECVRRDRELGE